MALRSRSAYQQRFKTARARGGHRKAQLFLMESGGGPQGRTEDQDREQRNPHRQPPTPRCSQGWKLRKISSVSGVGFRVASSSSTDTDRADATQTASENTT